MSNYDKQMPPPSYNEPPQQAGYGAPPPQAGYHQPQVQYGAPQPGYNQTTVIVNQPTSVKGAPRMWSTGICGICEDVTICMCGLFCGVCLACQVSTDMGESACTPICVPGAEITLRTKWRTQENIQGSIMDDCLTVWCCGPCAMCQLAREVQAKKNGTLNPHT